eukprot:831081-Rhodomonas_salina.2
MHQFCSKSVQILPETPINLYQLGPRAVPRAATQFCVALRESKVRFRRFAVNFGSHFLEAYTEIQRKPGLGAAWGNLCQIAEGVPG